MSVLDNYECDGQLSISDFLLSQVKERKAMDLTQWINQEGAQYCQIKKLIAKANNNHCQGILDEEMVDRVTNAVSVWVLDKALGYMEYLRNI